MNLEATDLKSAWIPPSIPIKQRLLNAASYLIGTLIAFVVMDRYFAQLSGTGRECALNLLMSSIGVSVGYELFWLGDPLRNFNSVSAQPGGKRQPYPKDNARPGSLTAFALTLPLQMGIGLTCLELLEYPLSIFVGGTLNFWVSFAIGGWVSCIAYRRLLKRAQQYPFPQPVPAPDAGVPDRTWQSLVAIGAMLWLMAIAGLIAFILSK